MAGEGSSKPTWMQAVIVVAHDRWFLEAVTTATLELEAGRSTYFPGSWSAWRRERDHAARGRVEGRGPLRRRHRLAGSPRFVERFRAEEESRQASAGQADPDRPAGEGTFRRRTRDLAAYAAVPQASASSSSSPRAAAVSSAGSTGLQLSIGERVLDLRTYRLRFDRGEHVVLLRSPTARARQPCWRRSWVGTTGTLRSRSGGKNEARARCRYPAYFSQHEVELDREACRRWRQPRRRPDCSGRKHSSSLGRFLFSGWNDARAEGRLAVRRRAAPART